MPRISGIDIPANKPIWISRAALAIAFALEVQALECTYAGPAMPSSSTWTAGA